MALQMSRTNARTRAVYPDAYGRIDKANGVLENNQVTATLNWYFNQAASVADSNGKVADPISDPDIITLEPDEAAAFRALAVAGLYTIIKARTAYSTATDA